MAGLSRSLPLQAQRVLEDIEGLGDDESASADGDSAGAAEDGRGNKGRDGNWDESYVHGKRAGKKGLRRRKKKRGKNGVVGKGNGDGDVVHTGTAIFQSG
jgi:hypothetical protein